MSKEELIKYFTHRKNSFEKQLEEYKNVDIDPLKGRPLEVYIENITRYEREIDIANSCLKYLKEVG